MTVAAVIAITLALAVAIVRLVCGVKLMTDYRVDDYLASSRARRLWLVGMIAPVLMVSLIAFASYATHLWWIELPAWLLAIAVGYKTIWAVRTRLSGRYREFYKAMQWR